MKVSLAVAVFCAVMLTVMSYPQPEPDPYQTDDTFEVDTAILNRYRRQYPYFQPPQFPGPQVPQRPPSGWFPNGNVGGNVDYNRGWGLVGHVNGDATIWRSRNGLTDVGADAHYSRGLSGPARGQQDYGGNVRLTHRF